MTVNAGGASRVFQVDKRCHGVHLGTDDHRRRAPTTHGGGLANYGGNLTLTNCTVSGNTAGNP